VGSGTSSGADLVLEGGFFGEANVDPNRAIHDEFLRAAYEWGFLGLFAMLLFFGAVVKFGISIIREGTSPEGWAFLAISVPLLISLSVENVLADSGSPGGVGYNLILTSMVAAHGLIAEKQQRREVEMVSNTAASLPDTLGILPER
jgi:O-antigen ligase